MDKNDFSMDNLKPVLPFVAAVLAFFLTKKFVPAAPAQAALPEGK